MKLIVIGTGTMGSGIVQAFAQAGLPITMQGINETELQRGYNFITKNLSKLVEKEKITEENKREVFGTLDKVCKPTTILASNTSSLSITEIAASTKRADRVIGMHFFN